jgi:hypothetical protein
VSLRWRASFRSSAWTICISSTPRALLFIGHGVLLLQLTAFFLTVLVHPGSPSAEWMSQAKRGLVECEPDVKRSDLLVPPRARYVRREDAIILHLDHYCWFFASAIGLHNRKYFVLYISYSFALAALAASIQCFDACAILRQIGTTDWPSMHAALAFADERVGVLYCRGLLVLAPLNLFSLWYLWAMTHHHWWLVARGRTALESDEDSYDFGWRVNVRDVMGDRAWLWLLQLPQSATSRDGVSWQTRPGADPQMREMRRWLREERERDDAAARAATLPTKSKSK